MSPPPPKLVHCAHLIVDEGGKVGLVSQELDHHKLVSLLTGQREQESVELRKPRQHRVVGLPGYNRRHAVLGGEVITPDLLNLLRSLL